MILATFTLFHVVLSLVGIFSGLVVTYGLLTAKRLDGWTALFLTTTAATSLTGFLFPVHHFMPSHAVGIVSLLGLAVAAYARYGRRLAGPWRAAWVLGATFSLYLNVFVLIAQAFAKVPALKSAAPTQSEPPFLAAQSGFLLLFVGIALAATIRFREQPAPGRLPREAALGHG